MLDNASVTHVILKVRCNPKHGGKSKCFDNKEKESVKIIDIHDLVGIEDEVCKTTVKLYSLLEKAKKNLHQKRVCELKCCGSYSDCVGTLKVNLSSLERAIGQIKEVVQ